MTFVRRLLLLFALPGAAAAGAGEVACAGQDAEDPWACPPDGDAKDVEVVMLQSAHKLKEAAAHSKLNEAIGAVEDAGDSETRQNATDVVEDQLAALSIQTKVRLQAAARSTEGEQVLGDAELLAESSSRYFRTVAVVGAAQAALGAVPKAEFESLPATLAAALDRGLLDVQERLEGLLLLLPNGMMTSAIRQADAQASSRSSFGGAGASGRPSYGNDPLVPSESCSTGWGGSASAFTAPWVVRLPEEETSRRAGLDELSRDLSRLEEQMRERTRLEEHMRRPPGVNATELGASANATATRVRVVQRDWPDVDDVMGDVLGYTFNSTDWGNMTMAMFKAATLYDRVQTPPHPNRTLFLLNLFLILLAFAIIILVLAYLSPLRGAEAVLSNEDGHLEVTGSNNSKFIQVCLPFWLPVDKETRGWLWLWLFAMAYVTSLAMGLLFSMLILRLALACDGTVLDDYRGTSMSVGFFTSWKFALGNCALLLALPANYVIFYEKLKGREMQWCFITLELFLMNAGTIIGFLLTFITRTQTNWLVTRKADQFWNWQRTFFVIGIFINIALTVSKAYVDLKLQWMWHRFLTHYMLDRYLANRAYYHLNSNSNKEDGTDNPDARITSDVHNVILGVSNFVFSMLTLAQGLITSLLIVWAAVPYWTMFSIGYCMLGSFIAMWFSWQFLRLTYEIERKNADFHFSLFNVRTMAEPIALFAGEGAERQKIDNRYEAVLEFTLRNINWNVGFGLFEGFYHAGLTAAPNILLVRMYFQGHIDFGGIGQMLAGFEALCNHLNYLHTNTHSLAALGSAVTRLAGLLTRIEEIETSNRIEMVETDRGGEMKLEVRDLTIRTPAGPCCRTLITGLNLSIGGSSGVQRLLVVGRSGIGKSSLLRSIAGLWLNGSGYILRPRGKDVMFLPQAPYMPVGNLRDQLRYPNVTALVDPWESGGAVASKESPENKKIRSQDGELLSLLADVGLEDLPGRFEDGFDQNEDWKRFLSIGEQQRVAAVRLMLMQPKLVVLDECTSALSEMDETNIYRRLMKANVGYVSVGHRRTLVDFHDRVLVIMSETEFKYMSPEEYREFHEDLLKQVEQEGPAEPKD